MFGKFGVTELIIILIIVVVIFGGRGKISAIMGDVGSGLKAFKKSVKDDEEEIKAEKTASKAKSTTEATVTEKDNKEA